MCHYSVAQRSSTNSHVGWRVWPSAGTVLPLDCPGVLTTGAEIRGWAEVETANVHYFDQLAFGAGWRFVLESEPTVPADVAIDRQCAEAFRTRHEHQNGITARATLVGEIGGQRTRC